MLSLLAISLLCLQIQAQIDPFPDKPGVWLPPGKRITCANWFPNDPCFYKDTYETQCFQAYDWDHMKYPPGKRAVEAVELNSTHEKINLATVGSAQNGAIDLAWTSEWPVAIQRFLMDSNENSVNVTRMGNSTDVANKALTPQFVKPNPPCCQWTQACFDFAGSHPPGYQFDEGNNAEEYYKMVCCLASWTAKCGGSVPNRPIRLRAPPECTMPQGHERVHAWDVK